MLAELPDFYDQAESLFQAHFQSDLLVHRLFTSEQEGNDWITIADQPAFEQILSPLPFHTNSSFIKDEHGLGQVSNSGRIDTISWLNAARSWFTQNNVLLDEPFMHDQLTESNNGVSYADGIQAEHLIFCEGMQTALSNPFFDWLPFALTKGEVLHIKCNSLQLDRIINGGVFILPLGNDEYKIGAPYAWDTTDTNRTEKAREELINKLDKLIDASYEIIEQKAGIRPTVKDRRPLLGTHPKKSRLHIFNGLGSRGVLMAPYLSKMMTEYLLQDSPIHPDADIKRFVKKHYSG